jgi:hypothetical protein
MQNEYNALEEKRCVSGGADELMVVVVVVNSGLRLTLEILPLQMFESGFEFNGVGDALGNPLDSRVAIFTRRSKERKGPYHVRNVHADLSTDPASMSANRGLLIHY